MTVARATPGKSARATRTFPPVEALESLAARVRPFTLNGDSIYYRKVLASLGFFARDDEPTREGIVTIKRAWAKLDRHGSDPLGAINYTAENDGPFGHGRSTKQLGYAWLYADLVHADDNERTAVEGFNIDHRFHAGSDLVTNAAVATIAMLNLIRQAHDRQPLPIPDEIFSERLEPLPYLEAEVTVAAEAPLGTPMDSVAAWLEEDTGVTLRPAPKSAD